MHHQLKVIYYIIIGNKLYVSSVDLEGVNHTKQLVYVYILTLIDDHTESVWLQPAPSLANVFRGFPRG